MAAEKIRVQLKWIHQAQFAGFYVAMDKGYYAKEDLDVV
ncbi:ABC transporter substrate-binding protein [Desulfosarcina cetonica]